MSKQKHTDLICGLGTAVMLLLTVLYLCFGTTLLEAAAADLPYVGKLFSTDRVHQIDIVAKESDWETMLENVLSEEYISCTVVIDGEKYSNIGIRPKGNSSLNTVAGSESDRYSFKLEFDHYDSNSTYHGLDKLCLNNAIQDNTYMKDFLCYQMMNFLGAEAPLSSFAWITVNGEDWGLYTAVEGIEDAFAQREYGTNHGQLYKPDSLDMGGGGRGAEAGGENKFLPENRQPGDQESFDALPEQTERMGKNFSDQNEKFTMGEGKNGRGGMGGSNDVLLRYSDDDPESYPNIFDNAVFDTVTEQDKARLIRSIQALNKGDVESCLNLDEVLRYFAVHNFVLNEDSYTGTMIHNYYLYEKDGLLSMVAWDYNLAFGGMGGGMGTESATAAVNSPIDSPVSSGGLSQRPMVSWIFEQEQYTRQYHQVMEELISGFFTSGVFEELMERTVELISPYVEKDPTAFCTYEEFQKGVEALREFCLLRAESVTKQLSGELPSTSEGQEADSTGLVDASSLSLSDMGSQGGMGKGEGRMAGNRETTWQSNAPEDVEAADTPNLTEPPTENGEGNFPQENDAAGKPGGTPPDRPGAENGFPGKGEAAGALSPEEQEPEDKQQTAPSPDGSFPDGQQENGASENAALTPPFGNEGFSRMPENAAPTEENSAAMPLLLGGSALLLLLGLLFAKFYH